MGDEAGNCGCVAAQECDIFEFMSKTVGLKVLHPGGIKATRELAGLCGIDKNVHVLDIACGKGTSAYFLHNRYGCAVTGIDMDTDLLAQAESLTKNKKAKNHLTFQAANAERLPFKDDTFDVTIFQAALVLIKNREKAISEAIRVTKPGGRVGALELSWQKEPTQAVMHDVVNVICSVCMVNVRTFDGWRNLVYAPGLRELATSKHAMGFPTYRDEGLLNSIRVAIKWLNPAIRKRMATVSDAFKRNSEFFGYGIYVGEKT